MFYPILELIGVALIIIFPATISLKKLTNIDYIGLGYDVAHGNPHSDLRDPGFKDEVFQLSYNDGSTSSDGIWLVPDKILALQAMGCSYETESHEVRGMKGYQDMLSVDAQVEGGGWSFKFSVSTEYKKVNEGTDDYHNIYIGSVAKCTQYQALIKSNSGITVTQGLAKAVEDLPVQADDAQYFNFIQRYGTHYVSFIVMGAKAVIRSEFEQMAWTRMQQTGINVKAAAGFSFFGFTGGASTMTGTERTLRSQFENQRSSYRASYIGSRPSTDGKWETWARSTGESPYPIEYTLRPITELFTIQYFPKISSSELVQKLSLLSDAYSRYCGRLVGCKAPDPLDSLPVQMDQVKNNIKGQEYQKCRPGYRLLSCGLANSVNKNPEVYRNSFPVDQNRCSCYDYFGASCSAWCTTTVERFEIKEVRTVGTQSTPAQSTAQCSAGKKVIGCHIRPNSNFSPYRYRKYFPNNEGNGCTCFDRSPTTCVASCASNIKNHEIRQQHGNGVVRVQCSPKNYVLGCGIKPDGGQLENYRTMFVDSLTSCQCQDVGGVTCYAICGTFG